VQNSLCIQVLRSAILAALLHGPQVVGVSQTLWRGTRNGVKELSHRAPPIFSRAAITLGIGPHSSTSPEHDLQNTDISFVTFKNCRSIKVHKSLNS